MAECIAVINAGSSSIKFALLRRGPAETLLFSGQVEEIGVAPRLTVERRRRRTTWPSRNWPADGFDHRAGDRRDPDDRASSCVEGKPIVAASATGSSMAARNYAAPVRVDADVAGGACRAGRRWRRCTSRTTLRRSGRSPRRRRTSRRSPASTPPSTAASRSSPRLFALPRKFTEAGVRRYGFHGLSYEYVVAAGSARIAPELADAPRSSSPISATAPACARSRNGRSVASTMGFTAVDGLMMGTRCGAIDPGVLLYLMDDARHGRAGDRGPGLQAVGPARRFRHFVRHAHPARRRPSPPRPRRSPCSSIASSARSDRWRRRWAVSTGWSSPAASARTTSCSGPKWPRAAPGSAWRSIRRSTTPARAASAPTVPACRSGSSRPTRSS